MNPNSPNQQLANRLSNHFAAANARQLAAEQKLQAEWDQSKKKLWEEWLKKNQEETKIRDELQHKIIAAVLDVPQIALDRIGKMIDSLSLENGTKAIDGIINVFSEIWECGKDLFLKSYQTFKEANKAFEKIEKIAAEKRSIDGKHSEINAKQQAHNEQKTASFRERATLNRTTPRR